MNKVIRWIFIGGLLLFVAVNYNDMALLLIKPVATVETPLQMETPVYRGDGEKVIHTHYS